jgi:hypothetical protein
MNFEASHRPSLLCEKIGCRKSELENWKGKTREMKRQSKNLGNPNY